MEPPPNYHVQHRSHPRLEAPNPSAPVDRGQSNEVKYFGYGRPSVAQSDGPQLFNDTANDTPGYHQFQQQQQQGYGAGGFFNPMQNFPMASQLMSDPMVGLATNYGQQLAQQGRERINEVVKVTRLKYFFAVDTNYVGKKLGLLMFPFAHRDWSVHYADREEPVAPRVDVNAPDLYIPVMAFVTFILLAGMVLGNQDRFSPELLGIFSSSALAWVVAENVIVIITKYIMNIQQSLGFFETLAFTGYKYVGMIACLIAYLLGDKTAYWWTLTYCSVAVSFFLIRSVKVTLLSDDAGSYEVAKKRKLYMILFIALTQPFIMWWLTSSVITVPVVLKSQLFVPPNKVPMQMG